MKKKVFGAITAIVMISHFSSAYALTTINEKIKEEQITSGVVLKNYDRFTEKGWLNINVLEVDLNDENTEVGLLNSENGLNTFQTVYQMANKDNIVAAINGDFFNGTSVNGNTIGLSISNGELLTTTYYENELKDTFASFILDEDNEAWVDYFTHKITLRNKKNKEELLIAEYNKVSTNYEYPVIYTSDWGKYSYGSKLSLTEMLVKDGKVKEIRENGEPFEIPEDGFVVATYGETAKRMMEDFKKNNKVEVDIEMDLDIDEIKMAVSGGAVLVQEGEIPETFSSNITGSNPRTAIGVSKDGNTLYLVTVDGRQVSSIGMTQTELAEFLKEKGVYNAINLDGGGSTTMVARNLGEAVIKTVNSPSGGSLRMVTNAIGIYNNKKTGSLSNLVLKVPEENVFVNSKMQIEVLGYDKYYNPVEVDFDDVDFTVDGVLATVEDGMIFAGDEAGTAKITAKKGKAKATISVDVLSAPNELQISPKKEAVNLGDSVTYAVIAKNKNGYYATLLGDDLTFKVISGDGKFEENKYVPKKEGDHIIEISVGDTKSYALVTVGESDKNVVDSFEKETFNFVSYPTYVTGEASVTSKESTHLDKSAKLEYDFTETEATRAAYLRFDEPVRIFENATKLSFKVYSEEDIQDYIKLKFVDAKGNAQLVMVSKGFAGGEWTELTYDLNSISLPATLTDIYVAQDKPEVKTTGTIYFDELVIIEDKDANISEVKLPEDVKGVSNLEETTELTSGESLKIIVFDEIRETEILLDSLVKKRVEQKMNNTAEVVVFTSQENEDLISNITAEKIISKGYSIQSVEGSLFITLDVSSGGIRISDYNQWGNLEKDIKDAEEKNIFVVMKGSLNDFTDDKERKLFIDTLCDLKRKTSKNILVIQDGSNTEISMERGVKYISVNNGDIDKNDPLDVARNTKYIEITVAESGDVFCSRKNVM